MVCGVVVFPHPVAVPGRRLRISIEVTVWLMVMHLMHLKSGTIQSAATKAIITIWTLSLSPPDADTCIRYQQMMCVNESCGCQPDSRKSWMSCSSVA